jgi:hypothetical protein
VAQKRGIALGSRLKFGDFGKYEARNAGIHARWKVLRKTAEKMESGWYRKVSKYAENRAVELKRWVVCVDS